MDALAFPWISNKLYATPVISKAQHEPHPPWFLTFVTAFLSLQSNDAGNTALLSSSFDLTLC